MFGMSVSDGLETQGEYRRKSCRVIVLLAGEAETIATALIVDRQRQEAVGVEEEVVSDILALKEAGWVNHCKHTSAPST